MRLMLSRTTIGILMARYAFSEPHIVCPECNQQFAPREGYLPQYADRFCRCPRCRVNLIFIDLYVGKKISYPYTAEWEQEDIKQIYKGA